jgi:sugar/nucleoside kinase (ribokinase family)
MIKTNDEVANIKTDVVKSIDTTGAGDLYASGFLFGYSKN